MRQNRIITKSGETIEKRVNDWCAQTCERYEYDELIDGLINVYSKGDIATLNESGLRKRKAGIFIKQGNDAMFCRLPFSKDTDIELITIRILRKMLIRCRILTAFSTSLRIALACLVPIRK